MAAHGERRDILEVDVVGRQRSGADEHRARVGVELVAAHRGNELVVCAALLERDALDDIVALSVCQAIECQVAGVGHGGRRGGVDAHHGVVQLVDTILACHVEGIALHTDALVQWPVEHEAVLGTAKDACIVGVQFLLAEGTPPKPDVIDIALERIARHAVAAAEAHGGCGIGGCRGVIDFLHGVPRAAANGHLVGAQRVGAHIEGPLRRTIVDGGHVSELAAAEGERGKLLYLRSGGSQVYGIELVDAGAVLGRAVALLHGGYGVCLAGGGLHGDGGQHGHQLIAEHAPRRPQRRSQRLQVVPAHAGALLGADGLSVVGLGERQLTCVSHASEGTAGIALHCDGGGCEH